MNELQSNGRSPRRVRRGKVAVSPEAAGQGIAFVASILQRSSRVAPSLTAMERIQVLAAREMGDAGSSGVSQLLRSSESAADSLIVGKLPVTEKVLVTATRATGISAHWILTGEGSQDPHSPNLDDEMLFVRSMRSLDRSHALRVLLSLNLDAVLCVLNEPDRTRCLVSIHNLVEAVDADGPAQAAFGPGELKNIRKNVAQAAFIWHIDLATKTSSMFTPLHEAVGVFGPERSPTLLDLLG